MIVPQKAGRGQAVADVQSIGRGDNAMAKAALVADDQVVTCEIEALEGEGIQREEGLMVSLDERKLVHERGADVPRAVFLGHGLRPIHRSIYWSVGIHLHQGLQNLLRPSHLIKPIVNNGHSQIRLSLALVSA